MKKFSFALKKLACVVMCSALGMGLSFAATTNNQTDALTSVLPASGVPFRVVIERAGFQLPVGIHSGVVGVYKGLWIFIAGRINGLHGFGPDPFPPDLQNTRIYVVNPSTGAVQFRELSDPSSGLNQQQIDTLTVTSPQQNQEGDVLYMTGGYGIDSGTRTFSTKPILTAIDLPGIVRWVRGEQGARTNGVLKNIRQLYSPVFQVTGGRMYKIGAVTNLVFGQNFTGVYTPGSSGEYTQQVRRFRILDNGVRLAAVFEAAKPRGQNPDFRRRDLNIVPVLRNMNGRPEFGLTAFAGVFTPQSGVWTVPVQIDEKGNSTMADPNLPGTFKQAMNQYVCANAGLYSKKSKNMYNVFFGGISYGFFSGGTFQTDSEIPFINQVTTIKMDRYNNFSQYLMSDQYPTILSTGSNPGNTLLFGAGAYFLVNENLPQYDNKVISLDDIHQPTVIGYIVGGIQSTLPNTNVDSDSAASPYVFKVTLIPA